MASSMVEQDLGTFLRGLEPAHVEHVAWRGGQIRLEASAYLTARPTPPELTSSGRCIVLSGSRVLVMSNPGGTHILPGGRIKSHETVEAATVREVMEETALDISVPRQFGVLVFRHLTPKPTIYRYPYPVFLNTVFVAEALNPEDLEVNDTYEMTGTFLPVEKAATRIPEYQQVLLEDAIRLMRG